MPYDDPLRVGMIGSYANRWANHALASSDVLLVLGSRLDIRQTGNDTKFFKGDRVIVHVDCEPGEINNRIPGCIAIHSELKPFLESALENLSAPGPSRMGVMAGGDQRPTREVRRSARTR